MSAYVTSQPDLGFAVFILSWFLANPTPENTASIKRMYKYLQSKKELKIVYRGSLTSTLRLELYKHANWAEDKKTWKLSSGYISILAGCSVSWSSKQQSTVAQSSIEAEYIAASEATKEAVWIGCLLEELCQPDIYPILLHCDNQGSIALVNNSQHHKRTKHIDLRYYFIRKKEEDETIAIDYLLTEYMIEDGLTKTLRPARMKVFVSRWGCEESWVEGVKEYLQICVEGVCQNFSHGQIRISVSFLIIQHRSVVIRLGCVFALSLSI